MVARQFYGRGNRRGGFGERAGVLSSTRPPELGAACIGLRAGLDRALHIAGNLRLARLAAGRLQGRANCAESIPDTAAIERTLELALLCVASRRARVWRDSAPRIAACRHGDCVLQS